MKTLNLPRFQTHKISVDAEGWLAVYLTEIEPRILFHPRVLCTK